VEYLCGADYFALGVLEDFPLFAREQHGQGIGALVERVSGFAQDVRSLLVIAARPAGQGTSRCRMRLFSLGDGRPGVMADQVAQVGRISIRFPSIGIPPIAADQKLATDGFVFNRHVSFSKSNGTSSRPVRTTGRS
jgi:hypothetical protein